MLACWSSAYRSTFSYRVSKVSAWTGSWTSGIWCKGHNKHVRVLQMHTFTLWCFFFFFFKLTLWHWCWICSATAINDPFIRSFARKNENAFWALKKYVEQTEDRELEGKLSTVEKYGSRIPELVARLDQCFESVLYNAGMHAHTHVKCTWTLCISSESFSGILKSLKK